MEDVYQDGIWVDVLAIMENHYFYWLLYPTLFVLNIEYLTLSQNFQYTHHHKPIRIPLK